MNKAVEKLLNQRAVQFIYKHRITLACSTGGEIYQDLQETLRIDKYKGLRRFWQAVVKRVNNQLNGG